MKKFAVLLLVLSASMFTIGCQPSTPAKKTEPAKTEAKPGEEAKTGAAAEEKKTEIPATPGEEKK